MDNEFLKKICSWRPKAFGSPRTEGHNTSDKSDPSAFQNGDSHSDISKINGEGKSPFLRRLNSSNLLISEGGIPSFEQFRKATGALWERAQDFIPSEKNEIEGEGRNRKEKEKENYDEIKIQKIENSNGEERVSFEGREKSRSCEADVRNNNTHSFDSYCDINNINKNGKNGKNDIDYENRSIYNNIEVLNELCSESNHNDDITNYHNNDSNYAKKDQISIENSNFIKTEHSLENQFIETENSGKLISSNNIISKDEIIKNENCSSSSTVKLKKDIEFKNINNDSISTVNRFDNKPENYCNEENNGKNSDYDRTGKQRRNGQRSRGLSNPILPIHSVLTNSVQHVPFDKKDIVIKGNENMIEHNMDNNSNYLNNGNIFHRERSRPMIVSSDDCIVNINNLSLNYNKKMF